MEEVERRENGWRFSWTTVKGDHVVVADRWFEVLAVKESQGWTWVQITDSEKGGWVLSTAIDLVVHQAIPEEE